MASPIALWQSVFPWDQHSLVLCVLVSMVIHAAGYLISAWLRIKTLNALAPVASSTMVLLALLTFSGVGLPHPRQVLITTLIVLNAVRVTVFMVFRSISMGQYTLKPGERPELSLWVFMTVLDAALLLPNFFVNSPTAINKDLGAVDVMGVLVMVAGAVCEGVADYQKHVFRNTPQNEGKWVDTGLFKYSRHPNYFGNICVFWGVLFIGVGALQGWQWCAVLSPLFNTVMLGSSSITKLEQTQDQRYGSNPGYHRYKSATSSLVPCPPWLYQAMQGKAVK